VSAIPSDNNIIAQFVLPKASKKKKAIPKIFETLLAANYSEHVRFKRYFPGVWSCNRASAFPGSGSMVVDRSRHRWRRGKFRAGRVIISRVLRRRISFERQNVDFIVLGRNKTSTCFRTGLAVKSTEKKSVSKTRVSMPAGRRVGAEPHRSTQSTTDVKINRRYDNSRLRSKEPTF